MTKPKSKRKVNPTRVSRSKINSRVDQIASIFRRSNIKVLSVEQSGPGYDGGVTLWKKGKDMLYVQVSPGRCFLTSEVNGIHITLDTDNDPKRLIPSIKKALLTVGKDSITKVDANELDAYINGVSYAKRENYRRIATKTWAVMERSGKIYVDVGNISWEPNEFLIKQIRYFKENDRWVTRARARTIEVSAEISAKLDSLLEKFKARMEKSFADLEKMHQKLLKQAK